MDLEGTVWTAKPGSLGQVITDDNWEYLILPDDLRKSGLGELRVGQRLLFEHGGRRGQRIAVNLRAGSSPVPENIAARLKARDDPGGFG
jgi:cold shock CspA family protein